MAPVFDKSMASCLSTDEIVNEKEEQKGIYIVNTRIMTTLGKKISLLLGHLSFFVKFLNRVNSKKPILDHEAMVHFLQKLLYITLP